MSTHLGITYDYFQANSRVDSMAHKIKIFTTWSFPEKYVDHFYTQ